jgi:hypothetical protein
MSDLYLIRNKQTGKYYRKVNTIGGVTAVCDADLTVQTLQTLFLFDAPEAAFQFLKITGKGFPIDTEVVPFKIVPGKPFTSVDVYPHVSVAVPIEAQAVLANPKSTPEEIKQAHARAVITSDEKHGCKCQGFYQPVDCPIHGRK